MTRWMWLLTHLLISCFGLVCGKYLGCYQDTDERLMKGYSQNLILSLTPDRCVEICVSKGFQYAGLKSRIVCFCDQRPPPQRYQVEETQCKSSCVGDYSKMCGGDQTLSVYSTRLAQREAEMKESPLLENLVGCYKDNTNSRLLSGHHHELNNNTPERCRAICNRLGYLYSGLEYGVQCFCGDDHPPPSLLRESSQCSTNCPGNPQLKCGGVSHLSIYDTGITDIPSLGMKLGCFDDEDPRVLDGYKIDLEATNSPRKCMNLCRSLSYEYSGLEYGVECFCGHKVNANNSRDSADEECNTSCPGDVFDSCGANWELQVYRTGFSEPDPVAKKVGCYSHIGSQLLSSYRQDFIQPITPQKCAKLCYNKGFLFSALITRTECWCDHKKPSHPSSVGNEECSSMQVAIFETGYIIPQPGHNDDYIGCVSDNRRDQRVLEGFYQKFENQLTPEKCSQLCFRKGYLYSGTKNKNECHCGDKRPDQNLILANEECSNPCSGDRNKFCGGSGKLSVYSTGISDISSTGKLVGCFVDDTFPRALDGHKTDLEKTNTPQRCLNYCRTLGFKFAGVEYQKECFCGNSRPSATLDAPDSQCDSVCVGDGSLTCGGGWRMAVYNTGHGTGTPDADKPRPPVTPPSQSDCDISETQVNGKPVCRGVVVFKDDFSTSSISDHWNHVIKIADAPDFEFVTFTSDPANSFQKDGVLVVKPTLVPDNEVINGTVILQGCTGLAGTRECEMTAFSYNILPPVRSARIHTRKTFSFRYGIVEIRARLPAGDWIVPELLLLPKDQSYGTNYLSGQVRVAMARGNRYLTYNGKEIGSSLLESGIQMGSETNVKAKSVNNRLVGTWHEHSHNYTLVWTPDNLSFYVDGQSQQALLPPSVSLTELLGFKKSDVSAWNTGSRIAPFDTEFYLSLGLSVGGSRNFPDGSISNNQLKPWNNFKVKAMLNFWLDKDSWSSTWNDDKSHLIIDHVQVTAL